MIKEKWDGLKRLKKTKKSYDLGIAGVGGVVYERLIFEQNLSLAV